MLSLLGLFQTALIVGVLSENLIIGPDEKRLMASIEKQRAERIRRNAAARLIQVAWRFYKYRCFVDMAENALNGGGKTKFLFIQNFNR